MRLIAIAFGLTAVAMMAQGPQEAPKPGQLPPKLKLAKPVALFNGKDFTGWTHCLTDMSVKMDRVWSVDTEEKSIVCLGTPHGYIRTTADYKDFMLKFEWRWNPKNAGNSGCLIRMTGEDKVWPKSYEAQLMSGTAGDFFLIDKVPLKLPADHPHEIDGIHVERYESAEKPLGEWNEYTIVANGGEITLLINGKLVNKGVGADQIAGKICLQSEGGEIHFRNIKIWPIKK